MFLSTDKISFRPIEREDLPMLRTWRNDPELRSRTREFRPLNMENQVKWFESLTDSNNIMFLIIIGMQPIGVCGLTHIDWKNRSAELSWYIGTKGYRGKGFARHIIFLLANYCFLEIGLHRFWAEVYVVDDKLVPMYEHLGFTLHGLVPDTYWWDGQWCSSAYLSILDSQWNKMRKLYLIHTSRA